MKIQRYDKTPTFGYDKLLNKELRNRLKNDTVTPPCILSTMKKLNTISNATEEELLKLPDKYYTEGSFLSDSLSCTKLSLATIVDTYYPDLHFSERECAHYIDAAVNDKRNDGSNYNWQFGLAAELDSDKLSDEEWARLEMAYQKDLEENLNEPYDIVNEDPDDKIEGKRPVKPSEDNTSSELIQKFEPTFSSPKGFDSLGGMNSLKDELYDKIIYPIQHPEEAKLDFEEYGKRYPRGIMLYGPPGCGKTFIIEALSQEAKLPLFKLQIGKAGSKYINETSANYQKAFDYVAEFGKNNNTHCILFIDEFDGFTKSRDGESSDESLKQAGTLLNLIETARDRNIIVITATNKYDIVDEAIRRRFDSQVYVGMPDLETREAILTKTLSGWKKGLQLAENKEDMHELALKTKGFPSSALVIISDIASNAARKDGRRPISKEDYIKAIDENANLKINEKNYQSVKKRESIGFVM